MYKQSAVAKRKQISKLIENCKKLCNFGHFCAKQNFNDCYFSWKIFMFSCYIINSIKKKREMGFWLRNK